MQWANVLFGIIQLLIGIIVGLIMRKMADMTDDLKTVEREMHDFKADVPKIYLAKEDYKDDLKEVKAILTKIHDKLDKKADK